MTYGIGTDIVKISHLKPFAETLNDPFIQKTYTEKELKLILSREVPLNSLATRFAGKEAVFKSLSISGDHVRLNEIEILENDFGQPQVILHGYIKKLAEERNIQKILISLSYDTDYAVAYANSIT